MKNIVSKVVNEVRNQIYKCEGWDGVDYDLDKIRKERSEKLAKFFGVEKKLVKSYEEDMVNSEWFMSCLDKRMEEVGKHGGYGEAGRVGAEVLYLVTRINEPNNVLQTGVMFGLFDAHILLALHHNGKGELDSIDLPEQPGDIEHGYFIPESLKDRWKLHIGDAKKKLPELMSYKESIDIFFHDSKHRYSHMMWEFRESYKHIKKGGIISSHDVINNQAFSKFTSKNNMENTEIVAVGISIK